MAWNTKFKKASAARRRQAEAETPRPPVAPDQIMDAKAVDPRPLFEAAGLEVRERNERELSIRQAGVELYRSTLKNGTWVHCHHDQTGIGDNIALARELNPGRSFPDAVFDLAGGLRLKPTPQPPVQVRKPVMPPCNAAAEAQGRQYLEKIRGISRETINHAEQSGFLRYTLDGVLTVGRDPQGGDVRAITRRAFDDNAPETKRDLKYSNKSDFPAILPGIPGAVVIVEGGIDALAVHDMQKRQGRPLPTVIVAGAAAAQEFLNRPHVRAILEKAEKVTVCYENEGRPDVQKKTDAGHDRQLARVREIVPQGEVQQYRPPAGCKDIADLNKAQQDQRRQRRLDRHANRPSLKKARELAFAGYEVDEIRDALQPALEKSGWHADLAEAYAELTAAEAVYELEPAETFQQAENLESLAVEVQQAEQAAQSAQQETQQVTQQNQPAVDPSFAGEAGDDTGMGTGPGSNSASPAPSAGDAAAEVVAAPETGPATSGKTQAQALIDQQCAETRAYVAEQTADHQSFRGPRPGMAPGR